jgi:hypothetical protein
MPIQHSYTEASLRLVSDAYELWDQGRPDTAGHLAGLSAECALKSILVGLGFISVNADGRMAPANRSWRVHINRLWSEFQTNLQGHSGARYAAALPAGVPPPYHDWEVDHRYAASTQFDLDTMARWMWAAIIVRGMLTQAIQDGEAQS